MWFRRRKTPPAPAVARANPTRIAVLEHDLLGIAPEPGSAAAAAIALRQVGGCFEHRPVDVTSFGELDQMMCALCGRFLMPRGDEWVLADPGDPRWG